MIRQLHKIVMATVMRVRWLSLTNHIVDGEESPETNRDCLFDEELPVSRVLPPILAMQFLMAMPKPRCATRCTCCSALYAVRVQSASLWFVTKYNSPSEK